MSVGKKKYYAVVSGQKPGIYEEWTGGNGAEAQVKGFSGARYRAFSTLQEAAAYLKDADKWPESQPSQTQLRRQSQQAQEAVPSETEKAITAELAKDKVIIYADGGCINNPGPGGYGVVLLHGDKRKELSAGYRLTTNNRMELTACIEGLKALKYPCSVVIYSDSRYVVDGIQKGWARRWRAKGWMRNAVQPAENADLWAQLLDLCAIHQVEFSWVKGHAGQVENERCDTLAKKAALAGENTLRDLTFERLKKSAAT